MKEERPISKHDREVFKSKLFTALNHVYPKMSELKKKLIWDAFSCLLLTDNIMKDCCHHCLGSGYMLREKRG